MSTNKEKYEAASLLQKTAIDLAHKYYCLGLVTAAKGVRTLDPSNTNSGVTKSVLAILHMLDRAKQEEVKYSFAVAFIAEQEAKKEEQIV